jgi:hypothetical protein
VGGFENDNKVGNILEITALRSFATLEDDKGCRCLWQRNEVRSGLE